MARKFLSSKVISILLVLLASGCTNAFQVAAKQDTPQAYRAFLESGAGSDAERGAARARLDDIAFERAQRIGTIAAIKRYREAFPDGAHLSEADSMLEALRYRDALAQKGPWGLEDFLARYPDGPHAPKAQQMLAERSRKAALASHDPAVYRRFLERYPDAPGASAVRAALAQKAWVAAAKAGTVRALAGYLRSFPDAPHRGNVEVRLRGLEIAAAVLAGKTEQATKVIESTGAPAERKMLQAIFVHSRLEVALTRLDQEALRTLAAGPDGNAPAKQALAALRKAPGRGRALSAAALTLATPAPGLDAVEISAGLSSLDARRRLVAVRALGYSRSPDALDPLARALDDENLLVRSAADRALRRLGASLDPRVRDVAFTAALQKVHKIVADPSMLAVEGGLRDGAGRSDARIDLRRAAVDPTRTVAALRLVSLETDPDRRWVALSQAALRLRDEANDRLPALETVRVKGPIDVPLLRQCSGLHLLIDRVLGLAGPVASQRAAALHLSKPEPFPWLGELKDLDQRLTTVLADAEARARVVKPGYLALTADEGAVSRAKAVHEKLAAIAVLAKATGVPGVDMALGAATRSPFPVVAAAAKKALAVPGPKQVGAKQVSQAP